MRSLFLSKDMPDADFWSNFDGDEFCRFGEVRQKLPGELQRIVGNERRVVNLMCGKYGYIRSDLGIDISEQMLKENRDIASYTVWDLNDHSQPYPLPDSSFDAAVMIMGIAYIRDKPKMFAEVYRGLDQGGIFVVGFDHEWNNKATYKWQIWDMEERISYVSTLFKENGFIDNKVEYFMNDYGLGSQGPGFGPRPFYLIQGTKPLSSNK